MDGIVALIVIIPIVYLILLILILNRVSEQSSIFKSLKDEIRKLSDEVSYLRNGRPGRTEPEKKVEPPIVPATPPLIREPKPEKIIIPTVEDLPPVITQPYTEKEIHEFPSDRSRRGKRTSEVEKFIGENLANKIGIAVLVLGIAFFVKYAIDKNWINEAGRVIIGLISGSILIGFAHYFRNKYRSFSSVLVGGGLSVFYFSVAFAFHQYALIGQTSAFIFMVIISGLGVVLSLFYNRQELAVLATIGAFITPFLVSTGKENYVALFTYLCIINTGLMVLSWFKRWPAINIIALIFTTIIYGAWLIDHTLLRDPELLPFRNALLFATLFYILFMAMHVINALKLRTVFRKFDFIIILATNVLYFIAGISILDYWDPSYKGFFTALAGIFNMALFGVFYRSRETDRNFVHLLLGLGISFLTLAVPIQFKGNHIVLFWSAELVLLLWLSQKSGIRLLRKSAEIVALLLLGGLINNWIKVYFNNTEAIPAIFNRGFITSFIAAIAFYVSYRLLVKEKAFSVEYRVTKFPVIEFSLACTILVSYFTGLLEIWYQFNYRYPDLPVYSIYLQTYTYAFVLVLLWIYRGHNAYPSLKLVLCSFCLAVYLFGAPVANEVSFSLAGQGKPFIFMVHWAGSILLLWLFYDLVRFFFLPQQISWNSYRGIFTWIATSAIILILSVEMYHLLIWSSFDNTLNWPWYENLYYKAGLTILWGTCSFIMMWLGMRKNFQPLRIMSLTLFTITIIKLFAYDIRNIPPGGKIAAFILLGILLLAVSFMYQRLKKIILEDNPEPQ